MTGWPSSNTSLRWKLARRCAPSTRENLVGSAGSRRTMIGSLLFNLCCGTQRRRRQTHPRKHLQVKKRLRCAAYLVDGFGEVENARLAEIAVGSHVVVDVVQLNALDATRLLEEVDHVVGGYAMQNTRRLVLFEDSDAQLPSRHVHLPNSPLSMNSLICS